VRTATKSSRDGKKKSTARVGKASAESALRTATKSIDSRDGKKKTTPAVEGMEGCGKKKKLSKKNYEISFFFSPIIFNACCIFC
jgi:hypothetical protein